MSTFDYTSRDYLSIRQDIINRAARIIPEWDGTDASDFATVFVDLWAYIGDVLHFYVDRAAAETFLSTATQRESVLAIANLMDYTPASARAARGNVTVKLTAFPAENINTYSITSASVSSGTVTFTTSSNHNLSANQIISVSNMVNSVFNINNVIVNSIPSNTTFTLLTTQYTTAPTGSTTTGTLVYNTPYVVPQYTTFTGYSEEREAFSFYSASSATLNAVNAVAVIPLIQGTIITNESVGVSTGRINQSFNLLKKNVDLDSITVQVYEGPVVSGVSSPVTYQYLQQMSLAGFNDRVFTTKTTSDGYTQIIFGNGYNGYIPTTNTTIVASYRTTAGSAGNIPANKISLVSGTPSAYLSVQASSVFSGGADTESIDSIRNNVSRLFRTQDRAVSLQDYKDLILQIAGVSRATAIYGNPKTISVDGAVSGTTVTFTSATAHGLVAGQKVTITDGTGASYRGTDLVIQSVPSSTQFTINTASYGSAPTSTTTGATATARATVVLYPVPHQSSYPPTPTNVSGTDKVIIEIPTPMAESIDGYFSTRSMLGVDAYTINPTNIGSVDKYIECTPIYVGMKVYVRDTFVQSWVKDEVDTAIRSLLSFEKVSFGQTITIGDVYRLALTVPGVDYVELTTLDTTYDSDPTTLGTVGNITVSTTKLPCFVDLTLPSATKAINLAMYGGITGSN